jgi:hypothetical protein
MTIVKDVVYCHRAYRKLRERFRSRHLLSFAAMSVPFLAVIILFAPQILFYFNSAAQYFLRFWFDTSVGSVITPYALFGNVSLTVLMGSYPTPTYCVGLALASILGMVTLMNIHRIPRSVSVYASFVLLITLVSALYFLFIPERFPYTIEKFSDLYIKTELGVWCSIPLILAMSLLILPSSLPERMTVIALTLLYSLVFGLVRYIIFLYILGHYSYVYMASMFIAFDPPLDTIYVVGMYSFYMSFMSKHYRKDSDIWQCS